MSSTGQHQVPQEQPRVRHAHEPNGPQSLTGHVQHTGYEASHLGPSKNDASPTQTGPRPADTNGLDLTATASISKELQTTYLLCPSHGLFFHTFPDPRLQLGPSPMERYLEEGPAAQHALFIRADTGRLSTVRDCTCRALIEAKYGHRNRE